MRNGELVFFTTNITHTKRRPDITDTYGYFVKLNIYFVFVQNRQILLSFFFVNWWFLRKSVYFLNVYLLKLRFFIIELLWWSCFIDKLTRTIRMGAGEKPSTQKTICDLLKHFNDQVLATVVCHVVATRTNFYR